MADGEYRLPNTGDQVAAAIARALGIVVPTHTSQLQNDSGFVTAADVPTKTSQLQNDSGFVLSSDLTTETTRAMTEEARLAGLIASVSAALVNYYTKSETYNKTEVNNLIGAIQQFHYEIYPSLSSVTNPQSNVLYLIGPTGSGSDKYEEYVYANSDWTKIGDTTIDLSDYSTTEEVEAMLNSLWSDVLDELDKKANKDGWYSKMVVGAAESLIAKELSDAVISYRATPSGTGTASIAKIKGRTDVWNQGVRNAQFDAVGNWNSSNATFSVSGGKGTFTASAQNGGIYQNNVLPKVAGRKVFVAVTLKTTAAVNEIDVYMYGGYAILRNVAASGYQTILGYITTNASWGADLNNNHIIIRDRRTAGWDAVEVASIVAIDLTLMYGAGREPATVAAFLAEYPEALFAPYNAGKFVNNKMTALVTNGFNQWNERWFNGAINENGQAYSSASNIAAYNFMPCLPSMNYAYDSHKIVALFWYDANRNFIYRSSNADTGIKVVTSPTNAAYFRFYARSSYGTTYKNDISINLSHSGIRNGEYEPYWGSERALNIPTMMGKKIVNGSTEGQESVNIFADMVGDTLVVGMKGIDSVYDFGQAEGDGYIRKVTKKIAAFGVTSDLSLDSIVTTSLASSNAVFIGLPLAGKIRGRNLSNKYKEDTTATQSSTQADKTIRLTENSACCIRDTSILTSGMTKEQVRTALLGVTFIYELETPEEYLLDTPIPSNYRVDDYGTERRLPDGIVDGAPASSPLVALINYPINLPKTYQNQDSMDDFANKLATALGFTWSKTWDGVKYVYTITNNS